MPIFTSDLPNDRDMIRALGSLAVPVPLFTDCAFSGEGENGASLLISVERKKIPDLAACILDGRFLYQAKVCKEMGCDVLVLIVEGKCRPNPKDGILETPVWGQNTRGNWAEIWHPMKSSLTYSRFDQYLTELDYLAGILVKRSADVRETAAIITALYSNFQLPPDKHNSLHTIFTAPSGHVDLRLPSLVRRVAKELDGIGWKRSQEAARRFPTVKAMCDASVQDWMGVDGVGKKTAERVVASLGGNAGKTHVKSGSKPS